MIPTNVTDKTLYAIRDSLKTGLQSLCCKLDTLNMLNSEIIIDSVSPLVGDTAPTGAKLFYDTVLQRVTLAVVGGLWAEVLDIDPVTRPTVNLQTGTTYTTQASDSYNIVVFDSAVPVTVTISNLNDNSITTFVNKGAGTVTFISGVYSILQKSSLFHLSSKGTCSAFVYGSSTCYLTGDLS